MLSDSPVYPMVGKINHLKWHGNFVFACWFRGISGKWPVTFLTSNPIELIAMLLSGMYVDKEYIASKILTDMLGIVLLPTCSKGQVTNLIL